MNKLVLFISFTIIAFLHFFALTFFYEKKQIKLISKPEYQKVSVQLASIKTPSPKKEIPKKILKEKEIIKKPIKKEAKRKTAKKVVKKIEKKVIKKKIIKEAIEKPLEKIVKKVPKPIKEVKKKAPKVANKIATQSLEKYIKIKEDYMTALRAAIDKNKKYPRASKRLGEQGSVMLSFRVLKNGVFQNMKILQSSGKRRLDKAALKALNLTQSFKPFTDEIKKEFMDISLPIKFKLR